MAALMAGDQEAIERAEVALKSASRAEKCSHEGPALSTQQPEPLSPQNAERLEWRKKKAEKDYERISGKFQRAFLTARKYGWDTAKCIQHGKQMEITMTSDDVDPELQADVALSMVVKVIKSEKLMLQKQYRALNFFMQCMLGEADKGAQIEALQMWSKNCAEEMGEDYERISGKFQRAFLTARKYGWDTAKCVQHGKQMEITMTSDDVEPELQADVALSMVVEVIKSEKLMLQKQYRALNFFMQCMLGEADKGAQVEALQMWSAKCPAMEYSRLYGKFQRAFLTARKYGWDTAKCIQHGKQIEITMTSGDVEPELQADVASSMVAAVIKSEKLMLQKQYRALNFFMQCMLGEADKGAQIEALQMWSKNCEAAFGPEYQRLFSKFQRAMSLVAQQKWSRKRCIAAGIEIEKEFRIERVLSSKQPDEAAKRMIAIVRAQKQAGGSTNNKRGSTSSRRGSNGSTRGGTGSRRGSTSTTPGGTSSKK